MLYYDILYYDIEYWAASATSAALQRLGGKVPNVGKPLIVNILLLSMVVQNCNADSHCFLTFCTAECQALLARWKVQKAPTHGITRSTSELQPGKLVQVTVGDNTTAAFKRDKAIA